ncbi:MAG: O-antigen ligase family protein [Candidatus Omnitrophica bacterium]|nr:O-antigen ligase family protein [Candidatus Omnitrophota bacterium]
MTKNIYKNILWLGMALLIISSPLWLGGARVGPLIFILLIAYSVIFMWFWRMNNSGEYKFARTPIDLPIILFALLAVISSFFSIYKHDSFYGLIKLFCYIGIYYLIINEFNRDMVKRLLYLVIGMGAALSVYGLLQHIGLLGHSWWDPKEFIAATFVNHNHFSGYLELVMPVAVIFLIKRSGTLRVKLSILTGLIFMIIAFILSQSRGAWISLSISFLAMTFLLLKEKMGGIKKAVFAVLIVMTAASLLYFGGDVISERISGSISAEPEGGSFATRLLIWRGAIDMVGHNPVVGTGIGTFVYGFPRYRPEGLNGLVNFAHNDYLETACDMGIPALIAMLWLIIIAVKTGTGGDKLSSYRFGCAIGVLSLSLHALSDFNFHIPANMLLFTIYLAVIMRGEE